MHTYIRSFLLNGSYVTKYNQLNLVYIQNDYFDLLGKTTDSNLGLMSQIG